MCIRCEADVWLVSYFMSMYPCALHLDNVCLYADRTCIDWQAYPRLIKHVLIKGRMDWYWWVVKMSGVGPACGCLVMRWCLQVKIYHHSSNHIALVSDHCEHCNDNMAWHSSATCDHRFTCARPLGNPSRKKKEPWLPSRRIGTMTEAHNLDMRWSLRLVGT